MANATVTVLEADGVTQTDVVVLDVGRQAAAASKSVAMATEDKTVLDSLATKLDTVITAVQLIDNSISGSETQVDVVAPLPAGTNNIGDVDVLTVPTDPFGANADAASATGSISAKLRAIATALGTTAFDLGVGTGGSRTLRVAVDTAQLDGAEYETVAASQTTQTLGATGATGDYLREVLVIPATTSPGAVQIKDGSNSAITVFTGGASSVSNLVPFTISLGLTSTAGAWQITTNSNVSCIGIGSFT